MRGYKGGVPAEVTAGYVWREHHVQRHCAPRTEDGGRAEGTGAKNMETRSQAEDKTGKHCEYSVSG